MTAELFAITGLGCLFPGADSPQAFWESLLAGRDTTSLATDEQMGVDPGLLLHTDRGRRDRYSTLRGGYVRGFHLDPTGLMLDQERLEGLDRVFTWALHAGRAALADASYAQDDRMLRRTGLVLGNLCFPTRSSHELLAPLYARAAEAGLASRLGRGVGRIQPIGGARSLENLLGVGWPAAVTAGALGLGGPRFAIDAACASSLYAVKLACDRLASGEADLMLAGAVSRADPLFIQMGFSIFQAYPERDGNSRPLDARSGGLVAGEGAGFVALRRYADAVRDGDNVYAVIRGIGLSNDGNGKHLLVPNQQGQRTAMERAYRAAGVLPASIAYVECHATGTPIGDATELDSMEVVFGQEGSAPPLIGSVKSNLGHLLTAAGMASLLKTSLALAHGLIPPTIRVDSPLVSTGGTIGGDRVVRETTSWPDVNGGARRAAVSAFGFGGTNAHVVLEDPLASRTAGRSRTSLRDPSSGRRSPSLAIVGMAAHFGEHSDLHALDRALYEGHAAPTAPPTGRWSGMDARPDLLDAVGAPVAAPVGGYMKSFELDFLRAGVPPDSGDRPIPQQLLLFDVADRAARDAGLRPGANVAVIVAVEAELELHRFLGRVDLDWQLPRLLDRLGLDLSDADRAALVEEAKDAVHGPAQVNQYVSFIGNVIACRVASRWDFNGPAFTVSAGETSAFRALEIARDLLGAGEVEAVVLGGVDLAGSLEAVMARAWADVDGTARVGEGAGAVVLRRTEDVRVEGGRARALVQSVALTSPSTGLDAVRDAAGRALALAGVAAEEIGYLELGACGGVARDRAEVSGLAAAYAAASDSAAEPSCAVGSAAHVIGDTRAASGIAGLIHAALCLEGRHLPPAPDLPELGARVPWYVGAHARTWLRPERARRLAAVSGVGADGTAAHVVLAEGSAPAPDATLLTRRSRARLVPVCAADSESLVRQLALLADELETGASVESVAAGRVTDLARDPNAPLRVVLVGSDAPEIGRQARLAAAGVPAALGAGESWQTPQGSCFVPLPLGEQPGAVCLVYPGGFSAYPGLADDLFQLFPALHEQLGERTCDPAEATGERRIRPRSSHSPDEAGLAAAKAALRNDPGTMLQAGTTYALATTAVLRDWFGLAPAAALGYSMGEGSMLWALGVWRAGDEAQRRLRESSLFTTRLVGPCESVAQRVPGGWASAVVRAPARQIQDAVDHEPQIWLTHVNAPSEVVIAGAAADVRRLAEASGSEWFPSPVTAAIHCEPMRHELDDLIALHLLPVVDTPPIRLYSAADYAPGPVEAAGLARNLARAMCEPMDFVRLVERAWQDGARVFVEMGPGAACTRWIGEILAERPHAALSVDARGLDDATALVRALARLVAERVPLKLDALLGETPDSENDEPAAVVRTVSLGGGDLVPFGRQHEPVAAPTAVLDEQALLAFAGGRIADAFGPTFAAIDGYRRRVRLPLPPYLLVSRVTELSGSLGVFEPCSVTTEYDVPEGAWYTVDGQVPLAVAVESGQCDLLLISYLGVDFECRGERVYRLLDCTLTFLADLPKEGDTLRYEIRIDSFTRSGETLLFFFSYDCYVGDERILEMRGGCAGFFTDEELAQPRGVVDTRGYMEARAAAEPRRFEPPLRCERRSFDPDDLRRLGEGDLAAVFGAAHDRRGRNPSLRLPQGPMQMIDRVVSVEPDGGAWGLGLIDAEKDLTPDDWYFPCHFQGDQVLAGSLMSDGCCQLLQVYLLYLGLHTRTSDARFQPVAGVPHRVICRGQVTPEARRLTYRLEVTALEDGPRPAARANCDILVDGLVVVRFVDLALELAEKVPAVAVPALYDERQIQEFTVGSVAACFGPEFAIYEGRRAPRNPNGDLQLLTRIVDASPREHPPRPGAWIVGEYDVPDDPWFTRENAFSTTPYSVLMEIGLQPCGFLSAHQGSSLLLPDSDLYFRNLDGSGRLLRELDLRGKTVRVCAKLTSSTALADVILQKFTYEVSCDGTAVFEGDASFGYFEPAALEQQVGLDSGRLTPTWLDEAAVEPEWLSLGADAPLRQARAERPHERLPGLRLHLLDRAAVVQDGGRHGLGYVYAEKAVDLTSWYFPCHFHMDPVMPGSLGVESIFEALQCFVLRTGLTRNFRSPRFAITPDVVTAWKYRGQIVEGVKVMRVEAHIRSTETRGETVLLRADASLWRDGLRIYELHDLALSITETVSVDGAMPRTLSLGAAGTSR